MYQHFHYYFSLKDISEIFYNFAVGIGTLSGVFAAYKLIQEWFISKSKQKMIDRLKKLYPRSELNISFLVADTARAPGKIYLIDIKKRQKYWIQSSSTYLDLGLFWDDFKRISEDEFDSYKEGVSILTSGAPGS